MAEYKFKLARNIVLEAPMFEDYVGFENGWCTVIDTPHGIRLTISGGYAWDGCTPKKSVAGLFYLGTPDGATRYGKPWTYYASLAHDVVCQFRYELGMTKAHSLGIFAHFLKSGHWPLAPIYIKAVDWFGPQDFPQCWPPLALAQYPHHGCKERGDMQAMINSDGMLFFYRCLTCGHETKRAHSLEQVFYPNRRGFAP